jgi:hypothetical protein
MEHAAIAPPLSQLTCPLCGGPNGCEPAASGRFDGAPCWCTSVKIPKEVLDRVPEADRRTACLCRRCATGGDPEDR